MPVGGPPEAAMAASPLLERDEESARISALLAQAASGKGGVILVRGPAGAGKTSLVFEARQYAAASGLAVAWARGAELESDFPFGVVRQFLEPLGRDPALADILFDGTPEIVRALLGAGAKVQQAEPRFSNRYPLLHGLYWAVANVSERQPLLIAIDDLHWADAPSAEFVEYLARRVDPLPVAILITARPAEDPPALLRLASDPVLETLSPAPLSRTAVKTIVEAELGSDPDADFVEACHEATAGNPFFLRELIRELGADGTSPTQSAATKVRATGPETVSRVILVRLARVHDAAPALAQAIAVLGDDAELGRVAELANVEAATATRVAGALVKAGILTDGEPLGFSHPIVRAAIYADMTELERGDLHHLAATLLERDGAAVERRAGHLVLTRPRRDETAAAVLLMAGRAALERGVADVAARYLARALEEQPEDDLRRDVLLDLGRSEQALGRAEAPEHLRESLGLSVTATDRASASKWLAQALIAARRGSEALHVLGDAVERVKQIEPDLALALEADLAALAHMNLVDAASVWPRLKRHVALQGSTPGERLMLANIAQRQWMSGQDPDRAAQIAERALSSGKPLREQSSDSVPFYFAVWALLVTERYSVAEEALDAAVEDARRRGSAYGFGIASAVRANLEFRRGNLLAAEADARAAIDATLDTTGFTLPVAVAYVVEVLIERGETDAASDELVAAGLESEVPENWLFQPVLYSRGRLAVAQARWDDGLSDLLEMGRRHREWGVANPIGYPWREPAARALAQLGRHDEAKALSEELSALAHAWSTPRARSVALRTAALVDQDIDVGRLRAAVDAVATSDNQLEYARALAHLGSALRRVGPPSEAREPLRLAIDLADRCGAIALVEVAQAELAATGVKRQRVRLAGPQALTPSERRVCDMAATGLTNREIAQALFVTVKTVELHLGNAYRKLDISSRRQLAEALSVDV